MREPYVIGSDEVGYGAWAGPLFVCAVAVPSAWTLLGLKDSKQLTAAERTALYAQLVSLPCALRAVSPEKIDAWGVKGALQTAHAAAITHLLAAYPQADVVVDGVMRPPGIPDRARCVVRADDLYPAVSAASIIAKVNRDLVMGTHHANYPFYAWDKNMGYGTQAHQKGLREHGVSPLHRRSYAPIQRLMLIRLTHQGNGR